MSDPVIAALIPKQWPGYVRVVTSAAQQFPNPKGAGGCLVQNLDSNYAVDLAPTVDFVPAQTRTIQPLQPYQWVADTPLWCRLTPSQVGSPVEVDVFVQPGGIAAPPTNPSNAVTFVQVAAPAVGQDWAYQLPYEQRLVSVDASLTTASGGSNRYPNLWQSLFAGNPVAESPMGINGIPGGSFQILCVVQGNPNVDRGTEQRQFNTFGSLLLPAGSYIQSATQNLGTGDQWSTIKLGFQAQ